MVHPIHIRATQNVEKTQPMVHIHSVQKTSDTLSSPPPSSGFFSTLWNWICILFCYGSKTEKKPVPPAPESKPEPSTYAKSHDYLKEVWKDTQEHIREKTTEKDEFITETCKASHQDKTVHKGKKETKLFIANSDILDLAIQLKKQGKPPIVLNPANAQVPGGGYQTGHNALEEDFFRRSALAASLDPTLGFQKAHFYPIKDNETIISPKVPVFRHSRMKGYAFFEEKPTAISFLTSAAIEKPPLIQNKYAPKDRETMEQRIYNQLEHAAETWHSTLVLTAFGCGAFKNPPAEVADLYMNLIDTYFPNSFSEIYFAIIDDHNSNGNYKTFETAVLKTGGKVLKL